MIASKQADKERKYLGGGVLGDECSVAGSLLVGKLLGQCRLASEGREEGGSGDRGGGEIDVDATGTGGGCHGGREGGGGGRRGARLEGDAVRLDLGHATLFLLVNSGWLCKEGREGLCSGAKRGNKSISDGRRVKAAAVWCGFLSLKITVEYDVWRNCVVEIGMMGQHYQQSWWWTKEERGTVVVLTFKEER